MKLLKKIKLDKIKEFAKKKPYISVGVFLVLVVVIIVTVKVAGREPIYKTVAVERKSIVEEVQSTGEVIPSRRVDLEFEVQGRVKDIKAEEGSLVQIDDIIISLEGANMYSDLLDAEAGYRKAKANLDEVVLGATDLQAGVYKSGVKIAQSNLEKAQISLEKEKDDLEIAQLQAEEDLLTAYEDALSTLEGSFIDLQNALNDVSYMKRTYFVTNNQTGSAVQRAIDDIRKSVDVLESYLDLASVDSTESIDTAVDIFGDELSNTASSLKDVREACEIGSYRSSISATDKTKIDNHRSYINTAISEARDERQSIADTRLSNDTNIMFAQTSLSDAEETVGLREQELERAQLELADLISPAEEYEMESAEADLERALASLTKARSNYGKTRLMSPCNGVVAKIERERGELVTSQERAASVVCEGGFEVEVDIPETDIGRVEVGDKTVVSLYAFPGIDHEGRVIDVEPAETIIQGVVYYKVRISLDNMNNGAKPGMTAEVNIITEERDDVLVIPQRAVMQRLEGEFIQVLIGNESTERLVILGVSDQEANIEVVSGVQEGDLVVTNPK